MKRGSDSIGAIVLAAGASTRMGTFKPLLPFGSRTVIECAIDSLKDGGVSKITVVTGFRAADLRSLLARCGVVEIENRHPERGMFSSVLAGIQALDATISAVLFLPADMPCVKPSTIRALVRCHLKTGAAVVYPWFSGRRGHPTLVARSCFDGEFAHDYPGGLAAVIRRYEDVAADVPVRDIGILLDLDTEEDYNRALAHANLSIPPFSANENRKAR